ncbi:Telomerase reverse transcriptase [Citrus sinensis]|uniref:Telomerase reverse transcriptase n=1 Tax=Citrus sinensis TaxID=2711 RepID=A0ACB8LDV3_CITSI|nr:Telomerase reverse transcriptase [Citrus sinensis]
MGKKNKRRVPEVLWRLYRDRARSLSHAVTYLFTQTQLPPSNSNTSGAEDDMSFLLKHNDPSDYRNLLNNCYIVINDNARPLPSHFSLRNRWSQHQPLSLLCLQIVKKTIEMIMSENPVSSNVISSAYDKARKLFEFHFRASNWSGLVSSIKKGPRKKRKRVDNVSPISERQPANSSVRESEKTSSINCVGCNGKSCLRPFSEPSLYSHGQLIFSRDATKTNSVFGFKNKGDSDGRLQETSKQVTAKSRKRFRPFSWQRRRNRRQINFEEPTPSRTACTVKDGLHGRLQYDFNNRYATTVLSYLLHYNTGKTCLNMSSYLYSNGLIGIFLSLFHLLNIVLRLLIVIYLQMQEKCPCCLILQAPLLVTKGNHIDRHSIFYSLEYSSTVLPRKHILNSLKPSSADAKFLIRKIFGLSDVNLSAESIPCSHSNGFCLVGSTCLLHSLVKLVKILIRRSQCCQHLRLLDKHCAIPSFEQKSSVEVSYFCDKKLYEKTHRSTKMPEASDSQFEGIKSYCLKSQVVSFLWAVCRSIIPADLLGTPANWRVLRRNISRFIGLRRFEKFSLKQCMHKLKTSKFPFLSNKHSSCYLNAQILKAATGQNVTIHKEFSKVNDAFLNMKNELLMNWISWFFSFLVVPLVQANFYITEIEHGKKDIYYYRKSVWKKLTDKAITYLKDRSYNYLDDAAVRSVINKRSFGFSKLRLLPKENGIRMLANLKASSRMLAEKSCSEATSSRMWKKAQLDYKSVKFDHFKPVNYVLRDAHVVLKGLLQKEQDKLGSSVFDYNDVYRKYCSFLIGLRKESITVPGVFLVVSDVSKAFDSIDQDKLLRVMSDLILKDEYILEQSCQVVCMKKSLWVHGNSILTDENTSSSYTRLTNSLTFPSSQRILVSQGLSRSVKKEKLFFILNEHVKRNLLQFDNKFYLQGIGIPQGSVVSSLLCSLYYGDMERNVLYPIIEKIRESATEVRSGSHSSERINGDETTSSFPNYMLLRFIDDFLFISTSRKQAANFFSRLQRGFREYNCYMNEEKYGVNFDIGDKLGLSSNRVFVGHDGITFLRWSGLLINSSTLEVQGDYTRYLNSHLSSTLTVCWQGKPAKHLKSRLRGFMGPKCHPIFFDSNINSAAVVRLNMYQAFLLLAMKFHCYISNLSYICNLSATSYLKIIEGSFRYVHVLIKRRMASLSIGPNICPTFTLEKGEVEWLGLHAYVQILKRKQSRHRELVSLLRSKLLRHRITGVVSCELKYAVEASHSFLIWKIKY